MAESDTKSGPVPPVLLARSVRVGDATRREKARLTRNGLDVVTICLFCRTDDPFGDIVRGAWLCFGCQDKLVRLVSFVIEHNASCLAEKLGRELCPHSSLGPVQRMWRNKLEAVDQAERKLAQAEAERAQEQREHQQRLQQKKERRDQAERNVEEALRIGADSERRLTQVLASTPPALVEPRSAEKGESACSPDEVDDDFVGSEGQ